MLYEQLVVLIVVSYVVECKLIAARFQWLGWPYDARKGCRGASPDL